MARSRATLFLLPMLASVLCSVAHADPARPARLAPRRIVSAELRAVHRALAEPLLALRRAVPAEERAWDSPVADQTVPVSRTYRAEAWRLGTRGADELARLRAVMRASLRPSPRDEVWHDEAEILSSPSVERVASAFALEMSGLPPGQTRPARAELPAIERLAARAIALVAAHPALTLVLAQCGWADAVGGAYNGVMIFDRATREVVWIHLVESWGEGE